MLKILLIIYPGSIELIVSPMVQKQSMVKLWAGAQINAVVPNSIMFFTTMHSQLKKKAHLRISLMKQWKYLLSVDPPVPIYLILCVMRQDMHWSNSAVYWSTVVVLRKSTYVVVWLVSWTCEPLFSWNPIFYLTDSYGRQTMVI